MSKIFRGKPPDPHSKGREEKGGREGKGRRGRGREGRDERRGERRGGEGRGGEGRGGEGREHPQIKFYDYSTADLTHRHSEAVGNSFR
jgi:hypothetical protein